MLIHIVKTLLYSFVLIAGQLACLPLLNQIWGYSSTTEIICITLVFAGFLVGLSEKIPKKYFKILLIELFLFELALGIGFVPILETVMQNGLLKLLVTLNIVILPVLSGMLLTKYSFQDSDFDKSYSFLHIAAFLFTVLFSLGIKSADNMLLHLCLAFAILAVSFIPIKSDHAAPDLKLNTDSLNSVFFGVAASIFINYFFISRTMTVYPAGLEFNVYLIFTNLFLAMSGFINKHILTRYQISLPNLFLLSGLLALATLALITDLKIDGQHSLPLFESLFIMDEWGVGHTGYLILCSGLLLFPYLLMCLSIPSQQSSYKESNHLFFVTLGNILGHILFVLPVMSLGVKERLAIFVAISFIVFLRFKSTKWQRMIGWSLAACSVLLLFVTKTAEVGLISHGHKSMYAFNLSKEQKKKFLGVFNYAMPTSEIFYKGTNFSGLIHERAFTSSVVLNGYYADTYLPFDYLKAQLAYDELKNKENQKILVIGLGNHILLKRLEQIAASNQISVLDNFGLFKNDKFLKLVADENNYKWNKDNIKFIEADAFEFVYRQNENQYDAIIWNLTSPNYVSAGALYTHEYLKRLSHILKNNGIFFGNEMFSSYYDCSVVNNFDNNYSFFVDDSYSIFMSTNKVNFMPQSAGFKQIKADTCNNLEVASLKSWMKARKFSDDLVYKDDQIKKSDVETVGLSAARNLRKHMLKPEGAVPLLNADFKNDREFIAKSKSFKNSYVFDHDGLLYHLLRNNSIVTLAMNNNSVMITTIFEPMDSFQTTAPYQSEYARAFLSGQASTSFAGRAKRLIAIDGISGSAKFKNCGGYSSLKEAFYSEFSMTDLSQNNTNKVEQWSLEYDPKSKKCFSLKQIEL